MVPLILIRCRQRIKLVQLTYEREIPVHAALNRLVESDARGAEHPRGDRRRQILRLNAIIKQKVPTGWNV